MVLFTSYRKQLEDLGWAVIPNVIDAKFGRMSLHFAVENDVHCHVRQKITDETSQYAAAGLKWTDRSNKELEKLSIFPSQLQVKQRSV